MDYANKMDIILKAVGIRTTDEAVETESQMRKSQSAAPPGRQVPGPRRKILQRSKSDSDMRFVCDIPPAVCCSISRDRSLSLDSVLSHSSTGSASILNPSGIRTPDYKLSPLHFPKQNIAGLSNSDLNAVDDTELVVPSNWEWNAWEDVK